MTNGLVASIHDICPRTFDLCRRLVDDLDRLGVRPCSLLVIPCDGGRRLTDHPALCAWLAQRAAAGDEIVQHGWLHHRLDQPPPRGGARLLDALLARGAGEFLDLPGDQAARRLADGRAELAAAGLTAAGFVAPAWLYGTAAAEAVRRAGFRYLTTHLRVRDLARGRDHWSFGVSNRPGALGPDLVGRGVNELFFLAHRSAPLARLAVHPADLEHGVPFRHTLKLCRRWLALGRQPYTYLGWLGP